MNKYIIIASVLFFLILLFILVMSVILKNKKYGFNQNKVIDKKKIYAFRCVPCDNDVCYALTLIKLNRFPFSKCNFWGSIIFKWLTEGKISVVDGYSDGNGNVVSCIDLNKNSFFNNQQETSLYNMLHEASIDGYLTKEKFQKWCGNNRKKFISLYDNIINSGINSLKNTNRIYKTKDKKICKVSNVMDDKIYNDSINLLGFKIILDKFVNGEINDRFESDNWNQYIVFSYLFNMSSEVINRLEKVYPFAYHRFNLDIKNVHFVDDFVKSAVRYAKKRKK